MQIELDRNERLTIANALNREASHFDDLVENRTAPESAKLCWRLAAQRNRDLSRRIAEDALQPPANYPPAPHVQVDSGEFVDEHGFVTHRPTRKEVELSLKWVAENPERARQVFETATGVPLKSVGVIRRSGDIYDLRVWRADAVIACLIGAEWSPSDAAFRLCDYLGTPPGISFEFERDGFVTIVQTRLTENT